MAKKLIVFFLLFSLLAVPSTKVRAIPAGVGVLGDSGSQSYRCVTGRAATSYSWPEVLQHVRGIDFGPGECQAYNQAWSGEKIFPHMDDQTGDTIVYINGGQVGKVIIMHGYNDLYSDPEGDPDVPALLTEYRRNVDRLLAAGLAAENILIIDVTQENWPEPIKSLVDQFNAGLKDMADEIGAAYGTYVAFHTEMVCRTNAGGQSYNYGGHAITQQWGNNWDNFRVSDGHLNTLGNGTLANTTMLEFLGISRMSDTELLALMNVQSINQGPNCAPSGARTTTLITGDAPDASVVGQAVTVSYTVSSTSGTPSGNVTVSDGVNSCTGTVAAGSCSITLSTAGSRTLTATYEGNSTFASSSDTEPHTVNKASTTTTIMGDSPDPSVVGQAVTVSYTVSVNAPGGGTPSGNVTVSDGVSSCTAAATAGSCTIALTTLGSRTLTASYAGNSNFNSSASAGVAHTVNQASTTTTITGDAPEPSVVGQAVTVSYTVSSTGGAPTGNVTVTDSASSATCTSPVAAGSCSITLTTAGSRTLTATYAGNSNYAGSSDTEPHTVNKASTTTTITGASPDPSALNQAVTVNFSVAANAPGSGTPTGSVTVTDSASAASCTATVAAGSCNITLTTLGARTLTATYEGDSNFAGSSDTEPHTVNQNGTTTTITGDAPDPSPVGQAVTVNYTVTSTSGTPTGNVTVTDGVDSCVGTVAAGTCNLTLSTVGVRTLTASYGGDSNFGGSISTGIAHKVIGSKTLLSIAAQDGWLLESGETTNKGSTLNNAATAFFLGDNAQKKQYRSVLSFSTKGLPDNAIITKITLKVKKQGVAGGGNPVNTFQGFLVDFKKGFFGSSAGLQVSDFQAGADKSYGPFKPALSNGWYTINLTPAKGYINKRSTGGGVTQIRLRFKLDDNNNAVANYLKLYSGNAPAASRPQLIIEFYVP